MTQAAIVVNEEPVSANDDLIADVTRQFKDEVGGATLPKDEEFALRQKFGLVAPQLTLSEQNLIRREERRGTRD